MTTRNSPPIATFTGRKQVVIASIAVLAVACHLLLRFGVQGGRFELGVRVIDLPLIFALALGGVPLVLELLSKLFHCEFGSDLLAGISIVTAILLGEYLAGTLVVLMLSGGEALEGYAVRSASSVLAALARRMPSAARASAYQTSFRVRTSARKSGL